MDPVPDDQAESQFEGIEFEWHKLKAEANLKKHKVSFDEAMTIFGDENALVVPDREHSGEEERNLAIGLSTQGRLVTLCFTERGQKLRIISARLGERWERREYEDANE
jgi:uncharacterized DUF497 family protein